MFWCTRRTDAKLRLFFNFGVDNIRLNFINVSIGVRGGEGRGGEGRGGEGAVRGW